MFRTRQEALLNLLKASLSYIFAHWGKICDYGLLHLKDFKGYLREKIENITAKIRIKPNEGITYLEEEIVFQEYNSYFFLCFTK